jgi:transcriptional regulator with XRE-family HTH domain
MTAQKLVARNMRRLRVAAGLSQEAFAVDAGIDRTYVSRMERELENPSIAIIERIAIALGVDIRELFDPKGGANKVAAMPGGRRMAAPRKISGRGPR